MVRFQHGVTLLELLATCAIVALLVGLALPGAARWLADASAERTLHRLAAGLSYARLLAVNEGAPVVVCPLDGDGRCDGDWSDGFALFTDERREARLAPGERPLRVFPGSEARVVLRAFRTVRYFRFLPNGQTDWQNGRFVVCPVTEGVAVRSLVINVQGRTRTQRPTGTDPACD